MLTWPLIKIKSVVQDAGLQKGSENDSLVQEIYEVFEEQKLVDIVVLVLHHIVDHQVHRSDLVILEGDIDWRIPIFSRIKNGKLFVKILGVLLTEDMGDRPHVKRNIWNHTFDS